MIDALTHAFEPCYKDFEIEFPNQDEVIHMTPTMNTFPALYNRDVFSVFAIIKRKFTPGIVSLRFSNPLNAQKFEYSFDLEEAQIVEGNSIFKLAARGVI